MNGRKASHIRYRDEGGSSANLRSVDVAAECILGEYSETSAIEKVIQASPLADRNLLFRRRALREIVNMNNFKDDDKSTICFWPSLPVRSFFAPVFITHAIPHLMPVDRRYDILANLPQFPRILCLFLCEIICLRPPVVEITDISPSKFQKKSGSMDRRKVRGRWRWRLGLGVNRFEIGGFNGSVVDEWSWTFRRVVWGLRPCWPFGLNDVFS